MSLVMNGEPLQKINFFRWVDWMDTINGINLFESHRFGRYFRRAFYVLQLAQLLVAYNLVVSCLQNTTLEEFAKRFNEFGGILLTFSRLLVINHHKHDLRQTANFINVSAFHGLNERASAIRHRTVANARKFLSTLLLVQIVTLAFWFLLAEYQARKQNVLLPMLTYLPFGDSDQWPEAAKFAFRLYFYLANTQLLFTFFGSYVITSCYLLALTIELRILNDSYIGAPSESGVALVAFLKERSIYKSALHQHITIVKRLMNGGVLLELVFIVCLLTINGLRLCTMTSDWIEVALSSSMILIYLFELFQYCWQVDEMELLHKQHSFAVYSTPWTGGRSLRSIKALMLITIPASQKPLGFKCGGMYQLSSVLFASMLQFIYSLLMMLLQFK
ncbi:uncharacterized protein LOC125952471 [Anopheles darlingi]|uniref:uncharacterized protein LOC125952471 n=1 Tax=Anopheles darlingi TaxID=43151 RepID=UPI0021000179|nr:uncharacterized protein LOC125952471 [Anopheles darlingi]